jgi:hypothetical protein
MKKLLIIFSFLLSIISCATLQEVPIQTIEKVEYRDSIVYVKEIVEVEVPKEKIVYVGPTDTTSVLTTSLAHSEAKIDKGILTHTLEQKGSVKTQIDTFFVVEYVDRIVEKEVPIRVEVEKEVIPNWMWWAFIYGIVLTLVLIGYIIIKVKLSVRPKAT